MSFMSKVLYAGLKMSGMKKKYQLPEDQFLKEVEKWNKSRSFYMPNNKKAVYKQHTIMGRPVLQIQKSEQISEHAILYFFGGGMVIGPDKGDIDVAADLMNKTGCDIWFPWYPLCTEHCITESYDMAYEILYGAKQNFIDSCKKCGVSYTIKSRPGMIHCYPMLPYSREAKEDFEKIAAYLAR